MPLYEYQCDVCGERFERIQKYSDALVSVCPACGGAVKKLISSPAIQFKGSGFYITDYAKSGGSETEKADKKAEKAEKAGTSDKPAGESKAPAGDQGAKSDKAVSTSSTTTSAPSSSGDSGSGSASTPASTKGSSNPPAK